MGATSESTHTDHYRHLSMDEIKILCRLLSNAPNPRLSVNSFTHTTYNAAVTKAIAELPERIVSHPGLVMRKLLEKIPDNTREKCGEMCAVHFRLRPALMRRVLRFIEEEIEIKVEATLQSLARIPGIFKSYDDTQNMMAFAVLGFVSGMWMHPKDFQNRFHGCTHEDRFVRQRDQCAACVLARIGSEKGVLVALRASMLVWMSKHRAMTSKRMRWIESWMEASGDEEYDNMMVKSADLARWVRHKAKAEPDYGLRRLNDDEVRGVMGELMRMIQEQRKDAEDRKKTEADRRFDLRCQSSLPTEVPKPMAMPTIKEVPMLSRDFTMADANPNAAAGRSFQPYVESETDSLRKPSTVFLDHDYSGGDFTHRKRSGGASVASASKRPTVFLDHNYNNGGEFNYRERHRTPNPIAPLKPTSNASSGSTTKVPSDYVHPRAEWSRIATPGDFNMPTTGYNFETDRRFQKSATPGDFDLPAPGYDFEADERYRKSPTPSLVSDRSARSSVSSLSATPSQLLSPLLGRKAEDRSAPSIAQSYRNLIGMPEMQSRGSNPLMPPSTITDFTEERKWKKKAGPNSRWF